ncbi:unnamed protein product [Blepharisma stoltei]|uniref:Chaperone protein DnaJ n=1 Tax=Blepharisma stoltei TaxID=1481888 RepID=A0AAU9K4I3_9CILI|nr:unnamed protein product [Blepharisma stoltei]
MFSAAVRGFRSSSILLSKKDFYKILGVPRKATQAQIKQAYFSLAKKQHPDINKSHGSHSKFSDINNAYETLGDRKKRRDYDNGQTEEPKVYQEKKKRKNSQKYQDSFEDDLFYDFNPGYMNDVFIDIDEFDFEEIFTFDKKRKSNIKKKGDDIWIDLDISFLDAVHGTDKVIKIQRQSVCNKCQGGRIAEERGIFECYECMGLGVIHYQNGMNLFEQECPKCNGTGQYVKNKCKSCNGKRVNQTQSIDKISIPKGVGTGQTIKIPKKGNFNSYGNNPGDLFVRLTVGSHPTFKRSGYDIISDVDITISQAVLGSIIEVDTLYGKLNVEVAKGTNTGDRSQILNYGISHMYPSAKNQRGSHYVKFNVVVPKICTPAQKEIFKKLSDLKL